MTKQLTSWRRREQIDVKISGLVHFILHRRRKKTTMSSECECFVVSAQMTDEQRQFAPCNQIVLQECVKIFRTLNLKAVMEDNNDEEEEVGKWCWLCSFAVGASSHPQCHSASLILCLSNRRKLTQCCQDASTGAMPGVRVDARALVGDLQCVLDLKLDLDLVDRSTCTSAVPCTGIIADGKTEAFPLTTTPALPWLQFTVDLEQNSLFGRRSSDVRATWPAQSHHVPTSSMLHGCSAFLFCQGLFSVRTLPFDVEDITEAPCVEGVHVLCTVRPV